MDDARTDEDLIKQVAGGDESGLEILYDRYARAVYSLVLQMVYDKQVAEELIQEVFVRVWRGAGSYCASKGRPSCWVLGIAHNAGIDELSRRGSRPRLANDDPGIGRSLLEVADVSPSSHELTLQSIQRRQISEALAELRLNERQVLRLSYLSGLTQSEIAETCGVPLGTVKTRTRRALGNLRAYLEARGVELDEPR